jgi:acetyl-CoA carboxylase beta subunit
MTTESLVAPTSTGDIDVVVLSWLDDALTSLDPLGFAGYVPPAAADESVRTAAISVAGVEAVWIDCDFGRVGGTMGAVAGHRIVTAFDEATRRRLPVVQTVSSGGARLQEGMVSLVQMARAASAVLRHREAGLMSAAYLHAPTTGGVFASWASLSDVRAAEPGATIGFGGPRVVEQVTGTRPPASSHTAESALLHGLVDEIVPIERRWQWLAAAIGARVGAPLALPPGRPALTPVDPVPGEPYELLLRCRAPHRASGLEWAACLADSWTEIRGSDPGVRAGLATIDGQRIVLIAMDRHAGDGSRHLPGPGAFRVAQRALELAGRLGLSVLTLVDTPGADPAPGSEAGGVAGEIARTLLAMAGLGTPSVALCVGEGGSGGAMALAHVDQLLLLDGSVFSVIGPEAGATILYRDAARAAELTRALRMTAAELHVLGVADSVVADEPGAVRSAVLRALASARVGDRDRRIDELTTAAISAEPATKDGRP